MVSEATQAGIEQLHYTYSGTEIPVEFHPSKDDARLLLYQRCLDAGWTRAKATRYLNKVLPANP